LNRRSSSYRLGAHARASLRVLPLIAFCALAVACGDPDDDENGSVGQMPNSSQAGDSGVVDTGVPMQQPSTQDAGSTNMNPPRADTGVMTGPIDAGMMMPPGADAGHDAGHDAALPMGDAGAHSDSGAGGACPTYDDFGKMFMMTYCVTCHAGARPQHNVLLDTLANVQKNKTAIKRVAVTTTAMPEANPKPTAAERTKLGQWLDCGPM
jgi:hypothetical protein